MHLFNHSLTQTSNQPITWQHLSAFRHVDTINTTCWSIMNLTEHQNEEGLWSEHGIIVGTRWAAQGISEVPDVLIDPWAAVLWVKMNIVTVSVPLRPQCHLLGASNTVPHPGLLNLSSVFSNGLHSHLIQFQQSTFGMWYNRRVTSRTIAWQTWSNHVVQFKW